MSDWKEAPRHFLFLLGSARRDGNTEWLARRAAAALPATDTQEWLRLLDLPLPMFQDIRHDVGVYPQPEGNERILLEATLNATDIVIASPLYWYSVSTQTKLYLDYFSAWMRVPDLNFKARMAGKNLWAISALSDEDRRAADPLVLTLKSCAGYLHMHWRGVLFGYGNRPGDVAQDARAIADAEAFFISKSHTSTLALSGSTLTARFGHVNLIARDWRALTRFYITVFGCEVVPPERDYRGPELAAGTGIPEAELRGVHLRLPGYAQDGPTLEVYQYNRLAEAITPEVNRPGFGHIAFAVEEVAEARATVLANGGSVVGEMVESVTAMGSRVTWCYCRDPEGNIIELQRWA